MNQLLSRPYSNLDSILGETYSVLDDGHVRVIDYMGDDAAVVQAARVSYGKGTKTISDDRSLIRYLIRNRHTTPLEMCELKLHIRIPMDAWRQMIRHRTASVNEYSTRYSEAIDSKQETQPDKWRSQSKDNKQGSGDYLSSDVGHDLSVAEVQLHNLLDEEYHRRLKLGVAKEQARKDLPLSTYTEAYWKCDLHNLLHFLSLRMDPHAQLEIRSYANVIADIVKWWVPMVWEAFEDYRLNAMQLSRMETELIAAILKDINEAQDLAMYCFGWLDMKDDGTLKPNRERQEFEAKAIKLGLVIPWVS